MDNDGDDEVVIEFTDFADPTEQAKLQTEFPVLSAIDTNCILTRRSRNRCAVFPMNASTSSLFSSVTATAATAAAAMKEVNSGVRSANLGTLREAARAKHEEAQALSQAVLSSGRSVVSTAASQASHLQQLGTQAAAVCATTVTTTAAHCEAA